MASLPCRVAALSGVRRLALAAALGATTALAQPPVSWPVVLFLALPPLAWLLDGSRTWRDALALGWVAGAAHFAAAVRPAAEALPARAVHNDLNGSNVLLDHAGAAVAGVIDFGDLLRGPRIVDLAVASTYGLGDANPAEAVADVAEGWARVAPLLEAEADALFDLAAARLALRVLMYEWRAARLPQEGGYALRHASAAYRALDRVMALPGRRGRDRVMARLGARGGMAGATS